MAKKKKFKKDNRKRNFLIQSFLLLFLFIGIGYATLSASLYVGGTLGITGKRCEPDDTLYSVLECAAKNRDLGKKYVGEHHDSFTEEPSKDIYHWYAINDTQGEEIQNRNNVIFANQCWQMIRTTDTGGVKLLYNGEAENGQCLDTRGTHLGYSGYSNYYVPSYYLGTSYHYDPDTHLFSLAGDITLDYNWNKDNFMSYRGKYSCRGDYPDSTCSALYVIYGYYGTRESINAMLNNNMHYSSIGEAQFDREGNGSYYISPSNVNYMYYTDSHKLSGYDNAYTSTILPRVSLNTNYYYADSYDYNGINTNKYTLVDPYQVSSTDDYSTLVGKYTLSNASSTYSATTINYILSVDGNYAYTIQLSSGNDLSGSNTEYFYGDSYVDNGDNTFSIPNYSTFQKMNYESISSTLVDKYVCQKGSGDTCSTMWHVLSTNNYQMTVLSSQYIYPFSSSVTHTVVNGTDRYTLDENDCVFVWDYVVDTELQKILSHRYTTKNASYMYSNIIYYVYSYEDNYIAHMTISSGDDIDDAMEELFRNQYDSVIKMEIDLWYEKYMASYSSFLEDVIYCNDRKIAEDGEGWYPFNNNSSLQLHFNQYQLSTDLSCPQVNDQLSISNSQAQLKYKVALITAPEMALLNNDKARVSGVPYWTMTPSYIEYDFVGSKVYRVTSTGSVTEQPTMDSLNYIRPAISLNPGMEYSSGDGSKENPYIVDYN